MNLLSVLVVVVELVSQMGCQLNDDIIDLMCGILIVDDDTIRRSELKLRRRELRGYVLTINEYGVLCIVGEIKTVSDISIPVPHVSLCCGCLINLVRVRKDRLDSRCLPKVDMNICVRITLNSDVLN